MTILYLLALLGKGVMYAISIPGRVRRKICKPMVIVLLTTEEVAGALVIGRMQLVLKWSAAGLKKNATALLSLLLGWDRGVEPIASWKTRKRAWVMNTKAGPPDSPRLGRISRGYWLETEG